MTAGWTDLEPPSEKVLRQEITVELGADRLRGLAEPSVADSITMISVLWLEIVVLLVGANLLPTLPIGAAIVLGVVIVALLGTRMNALGVVVHEGSHGLLAKSRSANDNLTNWAAAFWSINSVEEYRPTHRLHHRYLGTKQDPDRFFYLVPAKRGALAKLLAEDLLGVTAFRRATTRLAGTSQESDAPAGLLAKPRLLVGKAVTQVIVLGQFIVFQGVLRGLLFYGVFWLIPIVCLFPMIVRLKTVTEHYDARLHYPKVVTWTARSSMAGFLQNHIIGARMQYHFEHHVLPTIPFPGLKKVHAELNDRGLFDEHGEFISGGYVQFLSRAVTRKL